MHENAEKLAQIQATAERTRQVIGSIKGCSRSPDGFVEVVVDAAGELESLHISRAAMSSSPDVLARTLMSTIRSARAEGAAELRKHLSSDPIAQEGIDVLEILGVSDEECSETVRPATPRDIPSDEPWGQRSILHRP
ncbi:YbaB/EbfC family nucleoid-associated protein [Rhodococcus triatomae]|uniref:YbaB/EbfC family nucleoid-associated protein n=1 Tax=Rhodococcus triatomae TaxID=300028 RepID=UPI00093276D6|nr:YbaB/EbfC family nucleoid-associated protein [Rhodococcus triatomae]QNG22929.1 YbaB/EbfC family nucleoid-associated protein [Rhodococcus triatomae]